MAGVECNDTTETASVEPSPQPPGRFTYEERNIIRNSRDRLFFLSLRALMSWRHPEGTVSLQRFLFRLLRIGQVDAHKESGQTCAG